MWMFITITGQFLSQKKVKYSGSYPEQSSLRRPAFWSRDSEVRGIKGKYFWSNLTSEQNQHPAFVIAITFLSLSPEIMQRSQSYLGKIDSLPFHESYKRYKRARKLQSSLFTWLSWLSQMFF